MTAYVVMIRERTLDPEELARYADLAKSAREGHQVTPRARYGAMEVLEGPNAEGCLIHEFPTIKDAQNWYHSAKYQEALKHRLKGAEYRVLIVEGLEA